MKCQNCQKRMEADWKYCPVCGADFAFDSAKRQSSPGAKYLPEAFSDYVYRHGLALFEDEQFYRTFVFYVLNVSKDLPQLIHDRAPLVEQAKKQAGKKYEGAIEHLLWCALSLCSDKYFEEKGRLYDWTAAQEELMLESWYQLLSKAFIPTGADRRLDMVILRSWQEHLKSLQTEETGPMSACKLCRSKCQYRYEAQVLSQDQANILDFNSRVNSTTTPAAEAAAWFTRLLSERHLHGGNLDLAYCFSLHLLNTFETPAPDKHKLSSDAQLILSHRIRESLEETDSKASDLKQSELSIGSIRQQVFEVIVRQALKGAPWREICAGPMQVNQITPEEVEAEVRKRTQN